MSKKEKTEQAARLYQAVQRLAAQAGVDIDESIEWLCGKDGGMFKLHQAYFSPNTGIYKIKFPRHSPRNGEDWIIDPAFIRRVMHSIDPDHPDDFTPTPEQVETTLLAIEVIPSNLYTSTPASKPWVGLTEAAIRGMCERVPNYDISTHDLIQFAHAIEAKLKEKNG